MTETALFMSVSFLPSFIEEYKSHPCLWHRRGKDYSNKPMREAAYRSLAELTRQIIPDCTVGTVKKKIDVIRGCFRKEMHKVKRSELAGSKPYVPKLWYFKMLLFLNSQDDEDEWEEEALPLPAVTVGAVTKVERPDHDHDQDQDHDHGDPLAVAGYRPATVDYESDRDRSHDQDHDHDGHATVPTTMPHASHSYEEGSFLYASSLSVSPATNYGKRRHREEKISEYAQQEDNITPFFGHKEDEYDKVGGNVAAKLRRMEPSQRLYAEHLINEVLFKGMLSKLSEHSSLQTLG